MTTSTAEKIRTHEEIATDGTDGVRPPVKSPPSPGSEGGNNNPHGLPFTLSELPVLLTPPELPNIAVQPPKTTEVSNEFDDYQIQIFSQIRLFKRVKLSPNGINETNTLNVGVSCPFVNPSGLPVLFRISLVSRAHEVIGNITETKETTKRDSFHPFSLDLDRAPQKDDTLMIRVATMGKNGKKMVRIIENIYSLIQTTIQ